MAAKKTSKPKQAPLTFDLYLAKVRAIYEGLELTPPAAKPPATAAKLAAFEKAIGHALSPALRAAWRVANGAGQYLDAPVLWENDDSSGFELLSVEAAQKQHAGHAKLAKQYVDADYGDPKPRGPRIASGWFLPGWVPFASFGGGSLRLMVDYTPGKKGTAGQIIGFVHDPDAMHWVASSFEDLLAQSLEAFEGESEYMLQHLLEDQDVDDDDDS